MLKTILAAALALNATSAVAADWRLVSVMPEAATFVDRATVTRSGAEATFWIYRVFKSQLETGSDSNKALRVGNCSDHSYYDKTTTWYLGDAPKNTYANPGVRHAAPDTVAYEILQVVCGDKPMDATSYADPYTVTKKLLNR